MKKLSLLPWPNLTRVSVQGVKSLGGHFACLCREFDFYEVKKNKKYIIIFQKEKGNTFTLLITFIVKSLQKEQNSTNLQLVLWTPICRNKRAITPKWINSLDTNFSISTNFCVNFTWFCLALNSSRKRKCKSMSVSIWGKIRSTMSLDKDKYLNMPSTKIFCITFKTWQWLLSVNMNS